MQCVTQYSQALGQKILSANLGDRRASKPHQQGIRITLDLSDAFQEAMQEVNIIL